MDGGQSSQHVNAIPISQSILIDIVDSSPGILFENKDAARWKGLTKGERYYSTYRYQSILSIPVRKLAK